MGIVLHFKTVHVSAQIVGFCMKSIHIGMRILTLVVRVAAVVTVELMVAVDMAMALAGGGRGAARGAAVGRVCINSLYSYI